MSSKKPTPREVGRPPKYPFRSMGVGKSQAFDIRKHPGAVQSAYQMGHRTGAKFSVHKVSATKVEITRTA